MRRAILLTAAGLTLAGAGCRHCGDRPRLFDSFRDEPRRDDCRPDCPPSRGASAPRLGAPLQGQGVSLGPVPMAVPMLPTYTAPVAPPTGPADLLPMPGMMPSPNVPAAPPSPAVPNSATLPPPSASPALR
jgi:hypothetical protein